MFFIKMPPRARFLVRGAILIRGTAEYFFLTPGTTVSDQK